MTEFPIKSDCIGSPEYAGVAGRASQRLSDYVETSSAPFTKAARVGIASSMGSFRPSTRYRHRFWATVAFLGSVTTAYALVKFAIWFIPWFAPYIGVR